MGAIIPGEYDAVARASRDAAALRAAHETPITRHAAESMLRDLARRYLPAADALAFEIRFTTRRGWGGYMCKRVRVPRVNWSGDPIYHWRTGKPRFRFKYAGARFPYVNLPSVPLTVAGEVAGYVAHKRRDGSVRYRHETRLRVGVVLHEFAHVLDVHRNRITDHTRRFTAILDSLVAEWRGATVAVAAEERPA